MIEQCQYAEQCRTRNFYKDSCYQICFPDKPVENCGVFQVYLELERIEIETKQIRIGNKKSKFDNLNRIVMEN